LRILASERVQSFVCCAGARRWSPPGGVSAARIELDGSWNTCAHRNRIYANSETDHFVVVLVDGGEVAPHDARVGVEETDEVVRLHRLLGAVDKVQLDGRLELAPAALVYFVAASFLVENRK